MSTSPDFLAHVQQTSAGDWRIHQLEDHLRRVSELAANFATAFDTAQAVVDQPARQVPPGFRAGRGLKRSTNQPGNQPNPLESNTPAPVPTRTDGGPFLDGGLRRWGA